MDAFDSIRDKASRLHDKLVTAGCDPLNPARLVKTDSMPFEVLKGLPRIPFELKRHNRRYGNPVVV